MTQQVGSLEITVLSLLRKRQYFLRYKELITRDFFSSVESRTVYKMISEFHEKTKRTKFITVKKLWFLLEKYIDEDDERVYKRLLVKIKRADISDREVIHLSVSRFAKHRMAETLVQNVAGQLQSNNELDLEDLRSRVDKLISLNGKPKAKTVYDYMAQSQARLKEDVSFGRIPTGLHQAIDDSMSGGLGPGELGFFLAPPKRGKTFALVNVGANALRIGKKVLHVTLEIQAKYVARRYDMCLSRMSWADIVDYPTKIEKIREQVAKDGGELTIQDYSYVHCSVAMVSAFLEERRRLRKPYDLLIVDFADLMVPPARYRDTRHELLRTYEELRIVAGNFGIPVWTASQGNRQSVDKMIVGQTHIAEAFNKVGIADIMISLNQTLEEKDEKEMRLYVAANRIPSIGNSNPMVRVKADNDRMLMEDIERKIHASNSGSRSGISTIRSRIDKRKSKKV